MKKFKVTLSYRGSIELEVEAQDGELALEAAREEAGRFTKEEFVNACDLMEDDHDVDEIGELKQAEDWWGQTPFRQMEQITGLHEDDFDGEDGSQDFVDACDAWWNEQSDEEKIEIWKANKDWN